CTRPIKCFGTISIRLGFIAMPPTPRADPIMPKRKIASASQCDTGAQITQAANTAMENATDQAPANLALTIGPQTADKHAPLPHPAFSQPYPEAPAWNTRSLNGGVTTMPVIIAPRNSAQLIPSSTTAR